MQDYIITAEIKIIVQAENEDDASNQVKDNMCLGYGVESVSIEDIDEL